eukprot:500140_1
MIDTPYLPVLHSLLRGPGDGFSKHLSYYSAIYHDDLSSVVSCLSQVAGLAKLSTKLEKTLKYAPKSKFWRLQINGRQVKQLCDGYLSIVECIDRNIKGKSVRETNWKRYHNVRSLYRVEVIRKQLGVLMTDSLERLSSDIFYTNWIKESKTCLSVLTQCFPEGITPTDYALCVCAPLLLVRFKKYVEHKQLNMSYKQLNEEDMESDNSCWKSLLKAKGNRQDIAIGTIIHWLTFYRIAGIEQFVHPGQDLRYDAANKWTYDRGPYDISNLSDFASKCMNAMRAGNVDKISEYFHDDTEQWTHLKNMHKAYTQDDVYVYEPIPTDVAHSKQNDQETNNEKQSNHNNQHVQNDPTFECSVCHKSFPTLRGMRSHQSKKQDATHKRFRSQYKKAQNKKPSLKTF